MRVCYERLILFQLPVVGYIDEGTELADALISLVDIMEKFGSSSSSSLIITFTTGSGPAVGLLKWPRRGSICCEITARPNGRGLAVAVSAKVKGVKN